MEKLIKSDLTKLSLALLSAVFILGCQDLGTGVVEADGLEPQFAKGGERGKLGGGGGDPTEADATVGLTGGLITSDPQDVQVRKDNASTLQVRRDGFSSQIALSATHTAGLEACGQTGGGEGLMTADQVLGLINDASDLSRWFVARFDKHDPDGEHWIRHNWEVGTGHTRNLDVGIGGLLKGYTAPDDTGDFSLNPRATVVTDGDVSTITFAAGFGIVSIQQRGGGVHLACPLRDEIVVVVDRK